MKWSRKYLTCQSCHTTDHPYRANGFCVACYFKEKYKNPKWRKKWNLTVKNWRLKNKDKQKFINYRATFKLFYLHYRKEAEEIIRKLQ